MSKSLGALTLPNSLLWTNKNSWNPVQRTIDRTIGGHLVIWDQALINGRKITLEGSKENGWFTGTDVGTLATMAASTGSTYALTWGSTTYTVVFDYSDGQAVEMQPVLSGHDYYFGTIRLIQVA